MGLSCSNRLILPISATFRVAERTSTAEASYMAFEEVLGFVAPLDEDFSSGFVAKDADACLIT